MEAMKMKLWIVITVLIAALVGGGVFFGLRLFDMTERIHRLEQSNNTLQTSYNELQSSYDSLMLDYQLSLNNYNLLNANYNGLQSNYNLLNTDFQSLSADYDGLEADYDALESKHDKLSGEVSSLKAANKQLEAENRDFQELLSEYENVPHSYYSTNVFKQYSNTWNDLSRFLTSEFRLPSDYEENVFDCSETSAYLEWALENAGFDAKIVVGPSPQDPTGDYHAWVIVNTTDYRVAVEATGLTSKQRSAYLSWGRVPGVVYGDDTLIDSWENYYEGYDDTFRNIYIAIRDFGRLQEWNWWVGAFGFE